MSHTGTYIFDKKLGKLVKVSNQIPSCKKGTSHPCCGGCCCGHHD